MLSKCFINLVIGLLWPRILNVVFNYTGLQNEIELSKKKIRLSKKKRLVKNRKIKIGKEYRFDIPKCGILIAPTHFVRLREFFDNKKY